MYFRLQEPWSFRGWKRMPYALRAEFGERRHERPRFLPKDQFLELLYCNGEEDVNLDEFSEEGRRIVLECIDCGIMTSSDTPMPPLKDWQRYHVFPSRFLESVHWAVTGICNFRCRHCLVSAPAAHHPQLPLEDCLHIVDEIARCGVTRVDITGGEPLVRNDLEAIVEALSQHNIDIGMVFTNASLLTAQTLDMFERHGQKPGFQLSFDGRGHHDWLRGVPGAETQAEEAFGLLQERGFEVIAAMCIHRGNKSSLSSTAAFLSEYGVRALKVNSPQELGVWKQYADEYALTMDEAWDVYKSFLGDYFAAGAPLDVELDGFFTCKKGKTAYTIPYVRHPKDGLGWDKLPYCESVRYHVHVGPEGRLAPCMGFSDTVLAEHFPSILEQHLGDATLSGTYYETVQTKVADLLGKNPECAQCEHLSACCGGCMIQGITDEGDYLVPDDRCCYFHKHIGEAAVREAADAAILASGMPVSRKLDTSEMQES